MSAMIVYIFSTLFFRVCASVCMCRRLKKKFVADKLLTRSNREDRTDANEGESRECE